MQTKPPEIEGDIAMDRLSALYVLIEDDMALLAGEDIAEAAWQDIAGTLATNLRVLANALDDIRAGKQIAGRFPFTSFPSMRDICEGAR